VRLGAHVDGTACSKEVSRAGLSALQLAALTGDLDLFKAIFERDPVLPGYPCQPIHLAAQVGHVNILQFILETSKDVKSLLNARTAKKLGHEEVRWVYGRTLGNACALHLAVVSGHLEAAEVLLKAGADLESRDETGCTALQHAIQTYRCKDIQDLLIGAGANFNTRDDLGRTPLMTAMRLPPPPASFQRGEVVKDMISLARDGLDLHATDVDGNTALHHAINSGQVTAANLLVEAGLDPTKVNQLGACSVQRSLVLGRAQFAVDNLPEVDTVRSITEGSILNTAALMGNDEVVNELLKRVPEKDNHEYVNLQCSLGTPFYCAAFRPEISILEKLAEKGALVNLVGGSLGSPLMAACTAGHVEAVTWLLRRGAELQCTKFDGTTITAEEAAKQHDSVLWLLRRFQEKGIEALDEAIPVKKADIAKVDEFMAAYREKHKQETSSGYSSSRSSVSGDESEDDI
jgi:ankyrin repeat protein